jgi:hypothetical protein
MEDKRIRTQTATNWLGADGIMRAVMHPAAEDTLQTAQENIAACAKICQGKKRPMLVDFRQIKAQTREARAYYAGEESAKIFSAVSLLVASPVSRVIGNFFTGLNRPIYPLRLFTSEDEALAWLKGFLA